MSRSKLHVLMLLACAGGLIWSMLLYNSYDTIENQGPSVCMIKNITGVPCPSCGSTRSVSAILHGDIRSAIRFNPFGLIITLIMIISPLWILYDAGAGKDTFLRFYFRLNDFFNQKWVVIIMVGLIIANWIWNISKGL
jgi:hypothetical protein